MHLDQDPPTSFPLAFPWLRPLQATVRQVRAQNERLRRQLFPLASPLGPPAAISEVRHLCEVCGAYEVCLHQLLGHLWVEILRELLGAAAQG